MTLFKKFIVSLTAVSAIYGGYIFINRDPHAKDKEFIRPFFDQDAYRKKYQIQAWLTSHPQKDSIDYFLSEGETKKQYPNWFNPNLFNEWFDYKTYPNHKNKSLFAFLCCHYLKQPSSYLLYDATFSFKDYVFIVDAASVLSHPGNLEILQILAKNGHALYFLGLDYLDQIKKSFQHVECIPPFIQKYQRKRVYVADQTPQCPEHSTVFVGKPFQDQKIVYDMHLLRHLNKESFRNHVLQVMFLDTDCSYAKIYEQLIDVVRQLKAQSIKVALFPGKSPYFLYRILLEIQKNPYMNDLFRDKNLLPFIRSLKLIAFEFSGRPGTMTGTKIDKNSFSETGRKRMFAYLIKKGIWDASRQKTAVIDSLGSGGALKSQLHHINTLFKVYQKPLPSLYVYSIHQNAKKKKIFNVLNNQLTFPDSVFSITKETLTPATYPFFFTRFPVPFDRDNDHEVVKYCPHGSWHALNWDRFYPQEGPLASIFEKEFFPYFMSRLLNPKRQ